MTKKVSIASLFLSLILVLGGGLIPLFAMGVNPPHKEKSQPAQEYIRYVSKYGFSIKYPAEWNIEEDTYGKAYGWQSGELPVWITDKKGNGINIEYIRREYYYPRYKEIEKIGKDSNESKIIIIDLIKKLELYSDVDGIDEFKESNVSGGKVYLFSGKSNKKKEILYYVIFYTPKRKVMTSINYFFNSNKDRKVIEDILNSIEIQ